MREYCGDVSDERAIEQLNVLQSILNKLGYNLVSGQAPNFHELRAAPIAAGDDAPPAVVDAPPASAAGRPGRLTTAAAFERTFLAWLHITHGIFPEEQAGTNAYYWRFLFGGSEVTVAIIGQGRNTATPPAEDTAWLLRIEQAEPTTFIDAVEPYFAEGSGLRRRMGGRIRAQFKSSALVREFDDQGSGTW